MRQMLKKAVLSVAMPIMRRAARAYVAGTELEDALRVSRRLASRGFGSTTAFWDAADANPWQVTDAHLAAIRALAAEKGDQYISLKAPSLHYDPELFGILAAASSEHHVRLHFDSLDIDTVDHTLSVISQIRPSCSALSLTLPSRWKRSMQDADWAISHDVIVRVVKGQWPDPANANSDLRFDFRQLIERLAGRAQHVAVASHDPVVVRQALEILKCAGTSCELELLYGLPVGDVLPVAKALGVPTRFYIPYGHAWLPYSLSQARRNPRILLWSFRDALFHRSNHGIYS